MMILGSLTLSWRVSRTTLLEHGRGGRRLRRHRGPGHPAEEPLDLGLHPGGIEVAGDHQRGVGGDVPAAEERLHVVHGGGLEILVRADDRVVVGVPGAGRAAPGGAARPCRRGGSRWSAGARSGRRRAGRRAWRASSPGRAPRAGRPPATAGGGASGPGRRRSSRCDPRWSRRCWSRPRASIQASNILVGARAVPMNIRCSKRWAKPVRPASSKWDPTFTMVFTATKGSA